MRAASILILVSLAALAVLAGCGSGVPVPEKCAGLTGACKELVDIACTCSKFGAVQEEACNNQCNAIVDEKQNDDKCGVKVEYWRKNGC